jgi:hypothetical protein
MVADSTVMLEDEGVNEFYSHCCKDAIYWNTACMEGGRDRPTSVLLSHFRGVEIFFGQPPCYLSSEDIFVEVAEEDYVIVNCLPLYELGDQLLEKNGSRRICITEGGEVLCMLVLDGGSCGSTRVAGLIGHYNVCLFGSRTNANPAPLAEAGVVDSRFHNFRGNPVHCHDCASAILVDPHLLVDVGSYNAPHLHPSAN